MRTVFAVAACRTPIGRIKGSLAGVRPDHLSAVVLGQLLARVPGLDPATIDDVYWGAANQAGEDNRNVARMAGLLAGLPGRGARGHRGEPQVVRFRDGGRLRCGPDDRRGRGRGPPWPAGWSR